MNNPQNAPTPTCPASPEFHQRFHLGQPWDATWLRFHEDMHRLGLRVHECNGAGGWGGPAVTVPRAAFDKIKASTEVKLDHHQVDDNNVMLYPSPVWA